MFTFIILLVVVAVFCAFVAMQPEEFRLSRSVHVAAPPAAPFAHIVDFHRWTAWSPWEKLDPNTERTYGGSPSGVGATYAWKGNKNVGSGNMVITEVRQDELVRLTINFIVPFKATNEITFECKPENGGTTVTQTMSGKNGFFAKAMHFVMSMEKMIGPQFEKGLNDLKAVAEASK